MPEQYLTFKVYKNREIAEDFATILKSNDIDYRIEEDVLNFDPSYSFNPLNRDYRLKLRSENFAKANEVLEAYFKEQIKTIDKDYYLFEFTDKELQDIIARPDEWGYFDNQLAQELLKQRGKEILPERKEELLKERLDELAKPEIVKQHSIMLVYLACFLFPPIAIIFGWSWQYSKKTLANGKRFYTYQQSIRKHGATILLIGVAMLLIYFAAPIVYSNYR